MLVSKRDGGADLSQLCVGEVSDAGEPSLRDSGANKLGSSHIYVTAS